MDPMLVKYLHVLSSTLLFGTGIGSAFYLFFISFSGQPRAVATVAGYVVIADWLFTASTVVIQPLTGFYLARQLQIPLATPWLYWSIVAYVFAVLCWLPVVWLQMRLRDIARAAAEAGTPLPARYAAHLGAWAALGVPALLAFLAIFYMMVARRLPFAG